ncbi:hypothetical protein YN1_2430 [Nanoarchaeota archaeon]
MDIDNIDIDKDFEKLREKLLAYNIIVIKVFPDIIKKMKIYNIDPEAAFITGFMELLGKKIPKDIKLNIDKDPELYKKLKEIKIEDVVRMIRESRGEI